MEALLGLVEVLVAGDLPQDRSRARRQREVDLPWSLANLLVHLLVCHALEEGLLHLMKWASPGQWEVWEGRAFLYLENATGKDAEDIHELYSQATWDEAKQRLHGIADGEYAERVVMDWMERRKALGETLDETLDPKIVPTFEAHTRASKALVHAVNRAMNEDDLVFVVGREHLEASKWGHGDWNLSAFLQSL